MVTEIRRVRTKTYIHDPLEYCQRLVSLICDEDILDSNNIAVIAKDEIIVKVVADRLQDLGLDPSEILKRVTIHSTNGIATRQLAKTGFKVHNEVASDEEGAGLPTLLASVDEYDLIIGNPAQQGEDVSRNNSWIQQIVKKCVKLDSDSPLKHKGWLLIGAPYSIVSPGNKGKGYSGLSSSIVKIIEMGHESFFPSSLATPRVGILAQRTLAEKDTKVEIRESRSDESVSFPWDEETIIPKGGEVLALSLLDKLSSFESYQVLNQKQKGGMGRIYTFGKDAARWADDRASFNEPPDGYPIPAWDWKKGEEPHGWVTDVSGKNYGVGTRKVIFRQPKSPPNGICIDLEGEFAVTENCVSWKIEDEDEAKSLIAFFDTMTWKKLLAAFKADMKAPVVALSSIPKISPMTDENIANELGFDNDLRAYIGLEAIEGHD